MDESLRNEIVSRLTADYAFKTSAGQTRLYDGECPSCGKKSLWAFSQSPWMLRCNRLNKCGFETHIKDEYPDLFSAWSHRHPQTPENPNASADAYLQYGRGFDLGLIRGWYTQGSYWDHERDIGSATVRFSLSASTWWERIIDKPDRFGDRKATFHGSYKGLAWTPPSLDLSGIKEIWMVEGIFDAIALHHHGIPSASCGSSSHYPEDFLTSLLGLHAGKGRPTIVWALDGDKAGRSGTKKWIVRARAEGWPCKAATIPQASGKKIDWNDLHQRERLAPEHLREYLYHGALLTASSAYEKASLMYWEKGWKSFWMEYDTRLWWFEVDLNKLAKLLESSSERLDEAAAREEALKSSGNLAKIADCHLTALYYLKNDLTDESWYYFRIDFPHGGPSVKDTITGNQLASSPEFKKRLLSFAPGAVWKGKPEQLDSLVSVWTYNIKTVATIDFIGYVPEYKAYVFNDIAIKNGKIYPLNDEDYFDLGKHQSVKTLMQSVKFKLSTEKSGHDTAWLDTLHQCFGDKVLVALAFWLGSCFSRQIVTRHESYPFLAITGEPGSGKTTVIQFLWKLFGRVGYEGFDAKKATATAFLRTMGQTTFPVVIAESDREVVDGAYGRPLSVFDWDQLKDAYGHGPVYSRGVKTNNNNTLEPRFGGSIVISQNSEVLASQAIQERIINLRFSKDGQTEETNILAEQIEHYTCEQLSYFLVSALLAEKTIFERYDAQYKIHYADLGKPNEDRTAIKNFRTRRNHAQIKALIDCLSYVCPITPRQIASAQAFATSLALQRERSLGKDHPLVDEFWSVVEYLEQSEDCTVNHAYERDIIAINLNHFEQMASLSRQRIPPISELKRHLRESKSRKFIDIRVVHSAIHVAHNRRQELLDPGLRNLKAESVRCWIFENR